MEISTLMDTLNVSTSVQRYFRYEDIEQISRFDLNILSGHRLSLRAYAQMLGSICFEHANVSPYDNGYFRIIKASNNTLGIDSVINGGTYNTTGSILFYKCNSNATELAMQELCNQSLELFPATIDGYSGKWYVRYSNYNADGDTRQIKEVILIARTIPENAVYMTMRIVAQEIYNAYFPYIQDEMKDVVTPQNCLNENVTVMTIPSEVEAHVDALVAAREEAKRQAEREAEEARQRELEEKRARLYTDSMEAISTIKLKDDSQSRIDYVRGEITSKQKNISEYTQLITQYKREIEALNKELLSYLCPVAVEEFKLIDIFSNIVGPDKIIKYISRVNDFSFEIYTSCPITYWEEDEVAQWDNAGPCIRNYVRAVTSKRFQVLTSAAIKIRTDGVISGSSISSSMLEILNISNTVQHPHVARYNCFGNNETSIVQAIRAKDYNLALAIINNCIMQINLTDACVVSSAARYFDNNMDELKWLDTETGDIVSMRTVLETIGIIVTVR